MYLCQYCQHIKLNITLCSADKNAESYQMNWVFESSNNLVVNLSCSTNHSHFLTAAKGKTRQKDQGWHDPVLSLVNIYMYLCSYFITLL